MKLTMQLLVLLVIILFPDLCFSQITIIEKSKSDVISIYKMGLPGGRWTELELTRRLLDNDTTYTLMYKNHEYSSILDYQTIQIPNNEALLQFRDIVMSVFTPPNDKNRDYEVSFKFGEDISPQNILITVTSNRSLGSLYPLILVEGKGYHAYGTKRIWSNFFKDLEKKIQ